MFLVIVYLPADRVAGVIDRSLITISDSTQCVCEWWSGFLPEGFVHNFIMVLGQSKLSTFIGTQNPPDMGKAGMDGIKRFGS